MTQTGLKLIRFLIICLRAAGAFGYFEVTHDITRYCKAKVFEHVGKTTPIAVRFSTVGKNNLGMCLCTILYHSFITDYISAKVGNYLQWDFPHDFISSYTHTHIMFTTGDLKYGVNLEKP